MLDALIHLLRISSSSRKSITLNLSPKISLLKLWWARNLYTNLSTVVVQSVFINQVARLFQVTWLIRYLKRLGKEWIAVGQLLLWTKIWTTNAMETVLPRRICSLSEWKKVSHPTAMLQSTDQYLKRFAACKWSQWVSTRKIETVKTLVNMNQNRSLLATVSSNLNQWLEK